MQTSSSLDQEPEVGALATSGGWSRSSRPTIRTREHPEYRTSLADVAQDAEDVCPYPLRSRCAVIAAAPILPVRAEGACLRADRRPRTHRYKSRPSVKGGRNGVWNGINSLDRYVTLRPSERSGRDFNLMYHGESHASGILNSRHRVADSLKVQFKGIGRHLDGHETGVGPM